MRDTPLQEQTGDATTPLKTVLIVEDDAEIGAVLSAILQDVTAYQGIHVSDGFAALKLMQTLIPQLIVLDYFLPGMNGLECLNLLRANKRGEQIPVILMSAAPPKEALAHTDLVFLEKPFDLDTFLHMIKKLLEKNGP